MTTLKEAVSALASSKITLIFQPEIMLHNNDPNTKFLSDENGSRRT